MPVYRRFGPSDVVHYSISTAPRSVLASGSLGWRGSTGPNGTISMYGGVRSVENSLLDDGFSIRPIYELDTFSIDGRISLSGSYPHTGSVSYARCVNRTLDLNDEVHASFWGEERFRPILNLYEYYSRYNSDYTTASTDQYVLFFERQAVNNQVLFDYTVSNSGTYNTMSSSFTVEALIKPLTINKVAQSNPTNERFIILERSQSFALFLSGSRLCFSSSAGAVVPIVTSSALLERNRWQHVTVAAGNGSASLYIDLNEVGTVAFTGSLDAPGTSNDFNLGGGSTTREFHGFMSEIKMWNTKRTVQQLSASFDRVLTNSGSSNLLLYARLNDGPLSTYHGFAAGSGAFDYSLLANHGQMFFFQNRVAPIWHPTDNQNFIYSPVVLPYQASEFMVVHVPSLYYGRQIASGSVRLTCNSFITSASLQRVLVDDGRGGLYLSGSAGSSSLDQREEYQGVYWNKVGNVFYTEGLIVIKDPALMNFGFRNPTSSLSNDILQVSFAGQSGIPTKVFSCRINGAAANASRNDTFAVRNEQTGKLVRVHDDGMTWVTAVGLYNKERRLVAVAKLASPVRNRERDRINIRLRLDF